MKISLIGSGTVGQATGIGLANKGNDVTFYDIDEQKLLNLRNQGYHTCGSIREAVANSEVIMISVFTPTIHGEIGLDDVLTVAKDIGEALRETREYKVVVLRSTVLPSTTRCQVLPVLERSSTLRSGEDFGLCFNPEFLTEKSAIADFVNPSRIVIGELNTKSGDVLERVYDNFTAKVIRTSLDNAETIKYAANLFLATKISFFNEFYLICRELGLDANVISEAVAMDPRIGDYGVWGGKPFGGKCLPKDTEAFTSFLKKVGINAQLLDAVLAVNQEMVSQVQSPKPYSLLRTP